MEKAKMQYIDSIWDLFQRLHKKEHYKYSFYIPFQYTQESRSKIGWFLEQHIDIHASLAPAQADGSFFQSQSIDYQFDRFFQIFEFIICVKLPLSKLQADSV